METFFTIFGLVGVMMSLSAYGLLTRGIWSRDDARYYWLNIVGTVLIGASIIVQWNLAAFVSQILWIIISIVGLVRAKRGRV